MLYAKKIEEENKKAQETEAIIALLEKEELEIIQRLKKTQELQEKAYESLQKSILN